MASPPFTPDETLPQPTDLISQYPTQSQTFRDVMESWMLINHDTDGEHFRIDLPEGSHLVPIAGSQLLYAASAGLWLSDGEAGAVGAQFNIYQNSASPADGDFAARVNFVGNDDTGAVTVYGRIMLQVDDVTDGTEDGSLQFHVLSGGSLSQRLEIDSAGSAFTGAVTMSSTLDVTGALSGTSATFSGQATFTSTGQNIVVQSPNTLLGPAYIRWQDTANTNIGYIGLGSGSTDTFSWARNIAGAMEIDAGSGGTVSVTGDVTFQNEVLFDGDSNTVEAPDNLTTTYPLILSNASGTQTTSLGAYGMAMTAGTRNYTITAHDNSLTTFPIKFSNSAGTQTLELGAYGVKSTGTGDYNVTVGDDMNITVTGGNLNVTVTTADFSGTVEANAFSGGSFTGTTGTFSGAVSMAGLTATTGAFSGAVSGTTGTFSGVVTMAPNSKIKGAGANVGTAYLAFEDGDTTRLGFVGFGSSGDADMGIVSDIGAIEIVSATTISMSGNTTLTGTLSVSSTGAFTGNLSTSGTMTFDSIVTSSDTTAILSTTGAGTVFLRPNGSGSATGQMTVASDGDVVINGTLTVTG